MISLIDDKLGKGMMEFGKGRLIGYQGEGIEEIVAHIGEDDTGKIIGEFGIGINTSPHHYDALVDKVSIRTNGEYLVRDGKFLV